MEPDDKQIDDLLKKTENLKDVTENIIEFFTTDDGGSREDRNDDVRTLFLSDMCGALAVTVNETMTAMYDRACRIETLISELPSLDVLDGIMVQLCGYCSLESCSMGFTSQILGNYQTCLVDDEKWNNKNGTTISDQYVQVFESLITARKRSLGQGKVFTPVCLFTGRICIQGVSASGGNLHPEGSASRGCLHPGSPHPRGSASRGVGQTPTVRILRDMVNGQTPPFGYYGIRSTSKP